MNERRDAGAAGLSVGAPTMMLRPLPGDSAAAIMLLSSAFARYAIPVLSIAVAIGFAKSCAFFLHIEPYVSTLLCAIMLSAWLGGFGPGLLATALAVLAFDYYLLPPLGSLAMATKDLARLGLFLVPSLFVVWLSATQRNVARSLQQSRQQLIAALEEQKRVEAELRRSEQRFRDYAETASDWFWETDREHRLTSLSRESTAVHGGLGAAPWEFAADREQEPEKWETHFARLAARQTFRDFRFHAIGGEGDGVCLSVSGKPLFDSGGGFLGYRGVASDITATIRGEQAQAALHRAEADLAHAARVITLGELTTSIAHEVNQPLTAILSNAEACVRWLDRGADHVGSARRSVEWIVKDVNRAAEVIGRVRALARKADTGRTVFDVNDVAAEVAALLRREIAEHRVALGLDLAAEPLGVLADRVQLQQVILNLLMNGVEAMQSVQDRPRDLLVRSRREQDEVTVVVEDSGIGFSTADADRLFNAFFTTKSGGLGLGLSICRTIVESHGGRLTAFRRQGPGSGFQFTLPLHVRA